MGYEEECNVLRKLFWYKITCKNIQFKIHFMSSHVLFPLLLSYMLTFTFVGAD